MFIRGNNSSRTLLQWYEARCDGTLPQPLCYSISIWWYRLMMLLWALWLAAALIRWLLWGWQQFSSGGFFRHKPRPAAPAPVDSPPSLPPSLPDSPEPAPQPDLTPEPPASEPPPSPQPPLTTLPPLP